MRPGSNGMVAPGATQVARHSSAAQGVGASTAAARPAGAPSNPPDILAMLQKGMAGSQSIGAAGAGLPSYATGPPGPGGVGTTAGVPGFGVASVGASGLPSSTSSVLGLSSSVGGGGLPLGSSASAAGSVGIPPVGPDGYGILGLLGVIRTPDRDLNVLALGTDLTSLNLNLNTTEPLHAGFAHPWSDTPSAKEPALTLPSSYKVPQPALKTGHFSKFTVGTLIYIFYTMPRDVLQAYSAQELYSREWRYHKENKLWFKKEAPAAGAPAPGPDGSGQYVYWDIGVWDKRPYTGPAAALVAAFLGEEEVRIRPAAPQPAPGAGAAAAGGAAGAAGGAPR